MNKNKIINDKIAIRILCAYGLINQYVDIMLHFVNSPKNQRLQPMASVSFGAESLWA